MFNSAFTQESPYLFALICLFVLPAVLAAAVSLLQSLVYLIRGGDVR